uniref:Uncharacterized protein n=1 Tax=Dunaliella tertiolecta TaxID=3047 RepID=A0A7S3QQR0_DUNTE
MEHRAGIQRGSREGGTRLNVSSRGRKEAGMKTGVSVGASEGQKGQRGKGGGAGDEGGSQKAAKRRAQGSERDGSGAERAERTVQPEHHEHGGGGSRDGIHKKVTAGKGSRVLDAQVLGGTGVEGEPQAKKSVAIKRPGLPSPKGLSKAKKSVGSGVAVGVKSSAGKAQGTQPGKTSHARLDKKGSRAGGEGKRKGGSAEEGGGSKGKDKGSKRSEGGPPKKKQALQQSKEAGQPEVARFPKRRRANAQPIEGKQMGLDGEEALQGFWNIEEPEYDCEGLLHDIRAVAKAEVRPVVVDEASGNCIHAPHTLTISGSLGSGWTYDPQTGYFPVRFVNRDGYYIRLEDGT